MREKRLWNYSRRLNGGEISSWTLGWPGCPSTSSLPNWQYFAEICIPISWNIYEKFKSFWLTSIGHALQIILGNSSVTLKNGLVSCLLLLFLPPLLLVASKSFDSLSLSGFTSNNHCRETFKITRFFLSPGEFSHIYLPKLGKAH